MKKIVFIVTLTLGGMSCLTAQVRTSKNLQQLIGASFAYFPKLKEAVNTEAIAADKIVLTDLNKNPFVQAQVGYSYLAPVSKATLPINGTNQTVKFMPDHNYNAGFNASYVVADFGRLKANIERAKLDLEYAKDNTTLLKNQLAAQVANIYYSRVYLTKAIAIQDSVIAFLEANKKVTENKFIEGEALKIDLLNIQASIDNEENKKIDLLNSLEKQNNLLEYATGTIAPTGNQFDFNISTNYTLSSLDSSNFLLPEFKIAADKINQAKQDLAITKLMDKPTVGLSSALGFRNGYLPSLYEFQLNGVAAINFTVPIYTGGKTKQQIKINQRQITQQELALSSLANTYKRDIAQAVSDINSSSSRLKNTSSQIMQAAYAQNLAAVRYKNGVGTHLELINASTNLQRAAFTALQYEYQLCLANIEYAKLLGLIYW
jgi:outer membrane protein TolC